MISVTVNEAFQKNSKEIKLDILTAGYGTLDSTWHGDVINSPYSRLYFVLRGEFYVRLHTGHERIIKGGSVYLIPSGCSYSFGTDVEMEHAYFHIRLNKKGKTDLLSECRDVIELPLISSDDAEKISHLIRSDSAYDAFLLDCEIRKYVSKIAELADLCPSESEFSPEIRRAIDFISENLGISLSLDAIARHAHLAKSTLTRKFRAELGKSIGEYIDEQIMLAAERELAAGGSTVLEISERFGFCDQFYFSRRFKAKYGVCPRDYRKHPKI